jgi:flagellar biosynthesis GTPase FlhF
VNLLDKEVANRRLRANQGTMLHQPLKPYSENKMEASGNKFSVQMDAAAELEQRVEKLAAQPLNTLSSIEIRDELIGFARSLQGVQDDAFLYDDTRYNPLLVVNKAIADGTHFSDDATLSIYNICQLKLVEFTFSHVETKLDLYPQSYNVLQLLQFAFARGLLSEPASLLEADHPARRFFERAITLGRLCDDASCPRSMDTMATLRESILAAISDDQPPGQSFMVANRTLEEHLKKRDQRVAHLEEQVIAKEQNQRKLYDVRHTVHDVIARATEGKRLPTFALHFLHEVWSKYLYITYLRLGVESPQWREGISDMYQLIWSLVTRDRDELNRRMAGRLSEALRRIRKETASVHHVMEIERFFNSLAEVHAKILDDKPIDPIIFEGAEAVTGESAEQEEQRERPDQPPEVQATEIGHWFKLDHRGRNSRVKLIHKEEEKGFLLLTDHSGVLVAKFNFDEFTNQVRRGAVQPLDLSPAFSAAFDYALARLEKYIAKIRDQITVKERELEARRKREAELERQRQIKLAQMEKKKREEQEARERKERQEQAERERQERIRQELELKRQLEEETRRQEEEAKREAERKAEEAKRAREEAFNKLVAEVGTLEPGGMVELTDEFGDSKICSLSLKLKRTGKLVFADRTGRRAAEYLPEEFAAKINEGTAKIIDYGATGDKRLDDLRWTRLEEENSH